MKIKPLTLRELLFGGSPKKLITAVSLSVVSGSLYALIIPTVMSGLSSEHQFFLGERWQENIPEFFFSLIALVLLTKTSSVILVNNLAKTAVARLRMELSRKINDMEVNQIEKFGLPKLLNVLTEDMTRVTTASLAIPMVLVSSVTALGMLVYLAILDLQIFLFTIVAIVAGLVLFQFPVSKTKKYYNKARDLRDDMQEGFRGLIFGSFELKLNREKSEEFLQQEIVEPIQESLKQEKTGDRILHIAGNSSEILCFFAIGLVVFAIPRGADFESQNLYGVVMALLYITGPIASILALMQQLKLGEIALKKINEIHLIEVQNYGSSGEINKHWQHYQLKNIEYSYNSPDHQFAIGGINLTIERGKTYFIVGGNGSGKSTLSKVISLHYSVDNGELLFDQQAVTPANLQAARNFIFVIYSDYYLFNRIYKQLSPNDLELIDKYLKLFQLDNKVSLDGSRFSTVNLSDGQRRRLALIVALVEDKEIYILDEWASDQDPEFKDLYYNFILPDLKQMGKTVIAITHDDRYFQHCDQIIKMENGFLREIWKPSNTAVG